MPRKHGRRVALLQRRQTLSLRTLVGLHRLWLSNATGSYKKDLPGFLHSPLWMPCSFLVHPCPPSLPRCQPTEYPLSGQFKANANSTLHYDHWTAFQTQHTSHGAERWGIKEDPHDKSRTVEFKIKIKWFCIIMLESCSFEHCSIVPRDRKWLFLSLTARLKP